ncbi:putative defense protein 3 [Diadema antillarum]|uniref:putative defense protein 3 n=2 Tax=Diadema antillarum TaxID=105358 RepID=UPI003A8C1BC6
MADVRNFVFLLIFPVAMAFPSGAPAGACGHLTPGHRDNGTVISPQSGASPYTVSADVATYSPLGTVTVSVTGADFRGILLQARRTDDSVVGTFSAPPANTKLLQCRNANDSVTHSSQDPKSAGTSFTWTAPDSDVGAVKFTATLLQEYEIFWVGLESQALQASGPTMIFTGPGPIGPVAMCSVDS